MHLIILHTFPYESFLCMINDNESCSTYTELFIGVVHKNDRLCFFLHGQFPQGNHERKHPLVLYKESLEATEPFSTVHG